MLSSRYSGNGAQRGQQVLQNLLLVLLVELEQRLQLLHRLHRAVREIGTVLHGGGRGALARIQTQQRLQRVLQHLRNSVHRNRLQVPHQLRVRRGIPVGHVHQLARRSALFLAQREQFPNQTAQRPHVRRRREVAGSHRQLGSRVVHVGSRREASERLQVIAR